MIPNQKVKMRWHYKSRDWYILKGYKQEENEQFFEVEVNDVMKGSHVKVRFICDYCNGENQIDEKSKYTSYDRLKESEVNGRHCCKKCKNRKAKDTLISKPIEKENSVGNKFPHLIEIWSEINEKTPYDYSFCSNQKVWWKCTEGHDDFLYEIRNMIRTKNPKGCPKCFNNKSKTTEKFKLEVFNLVGNEYAVTGDYKGANENIIMKHNCEKCDNYEYPVSPSRFLRGSRCPKCYLIKQRLSNEEFKQRVYSLVGDEYSLLESYININTKILFKHNNAFCENYQYYVRPSDFLYNESRCPVCNESKGEKRIRDWLNNNSIIFESQKEFNGLIGLGGGNLSYDFYLPKQNLLIEYQGKFHDGSGSDYTKVNLETQQEHDRRKSKYANDNNIRLLEIWYWDFDNIEKILNKELI
jgi:hypothetical protein